MAKRQSFDPNYYKVRETKSDLMFAVEGLTLPEIDLTDINAVMERIVQYFTACDENFKEPGVAGMCLWLGITSERWRHSCDGVEFNSTHRKSCERVMTLLESRIEEQMLQNKVNPVTAMFLLKSQFGYVDTPKPKKSQKRSAVKELPIGDVLRLAAKK